MSATKVIAIFDIGKTNKKLFLFDENLNIVYSEEKIFPAITDDDGFECDDLDTIEQWMDELLKETILGAQYDLLAVNFSAYGATMVYVDENGRKTSPVYNYHKKMPVEVPESIYTQHAGKDEFCRVTASPVLGSENCGHQVLWLKNYKPHFFKQTKWALFLAQYLGYRLHKKPCSELTSLGCHTGIWNHDKSELHQWTRNENIDHLFPTVNPCNMVYETELYGKIIKVGVGIHDSSASMAPYMFAQEKPFVLISTGTWCISMNPFNQSVLTKNELANDCLNYISIEQKPIRSSRLFLGRTHDLNVKKLTASYGVVADIYKTVKPNLEYINKLMIKGKSEKLFFPNGIPESIISEFNAPLKFETFQESYHQLMIELVMMNHNKFQLITERGDEIEEVFISGGFANSQLFVKLLAMLLPNKKVYTSEIPNASALGAAMMVHHVFNSKLPESKFTNKRIYP